MKLNQCFKNENNKAAHVKVKARRKIAMCKTIKNLLVKLLEDLLNHSSKENEDLEIEYSEIASNCNLLKDEFSTALVKSKSCNGKRNSYIHKFNKTCVNLILKKIIICTIARIRSKSAIIKEDASICVFLLSRCN